MVSACCSWPLVALAWGSVSRSSTRSPLAARKAPRLMAVVVLPTPPFWLARANRRLTGGILADDCGYNSGREMPLYNLATLAAAVGIGYLFGSIPFAIVVERWKKVDLRRFGSGNIGASNAFIVAGKFAGVLVLLGDASKGIAAVAVAGAATGGSPVAIGGAAVGAVVGHD